MVSHFIGAAKRSFQIMTLLALAGVLVPSSSGAQVEGGALTSGSQVEKETGPWAGCVNAAVTPGGTVTTQRGSIVTYRVTNAPMSSCRWRMRTRARTWNESRGVSVTIDLIDDFNTDVHVRIDDNAFRREQLIICADHSYQTSIGTWTLLSTSFCVTTRRITVSNGFEGTDLIVDNAAAQYSQFPNDPGNAYITGHAINIGDGNIEDTVELTMRVNDGPRTFLPGCPPEVWDFYDGCPIETWTTLPAGANSIELCVNERKFVREINHGNNCVDVPIDVPGPTPDLIVTFINPDFPLYVGEPNELEILILNNGDAESPEFELEVLWPGGGTTLVEPPLGAIGGGFRWVAVPWTPLSEGLSDIHVTVDPGNAIPELHEDNNHNSATFLVNPEIVPPADKPNLYFTPSDIIMSPAAPQDGDAVTFTLRMVNGGPGVVEAGSGLRFEAMLAGTTDLFSCDERIEVDYACVRTLPWTAVAGNYTMRVEADRFDAVDEDNENDNVRTFSFNVAGGSDPLSCEGTWNLTGIGHEGSASSQGSVINDCSVYWGQNTPTGCWTTVGVDGLTADWHRDAGSDCPTRVTVDAGVNGIFEYAVSIQ